MTVPVSLRSSLVLACTAALAGVAGCHSAPTAPRDHTADEAAIRQTDANWVKTAATHNVDAWDAFYAPDAVVLPPNEKTAADPASIRANIGELLGLPGLAIEWEPTKIVVSDAGDMAYAYGTYTLQAKDPMSGMAIEDKGKVAEIWRKQADGSWKCVLDTWSSDLPAPAPPKP